jgi:hypothetical protein
MGTTHDVGLLSAAGDLCSAADHLRAVGLVTLADEIDAFLATLEVEMLLASKPSQQHQVLGFQKALEQQKQHRSRHHQYQRRHRRNL